MVLNVVPNMVPNSRSGPTPEGRSLLAQCSNPFYWTPWPRKHKFEKKISLLSSEMTKLAMVQNSRSGPTPEGRSLLAQCSNPFYWTPWPRKHKFEKKNFSAIIRNDKVSHGPNSRSGPTPEGQPLLAQCSNPFIELPGLENISLKNKFLWYHQKWPS